MNRFPALCARTALLFVFSCHRQKEPVDYVNPYMGNVSHLLVPIFPCVQLPNAMLRIYPERSDYTSEYLNGLPLVVTNHRERSAFKLSVTTGEANAPVIPLSYDNEHLTPYLWEVDVADGSIGVRFAPSQQSAQYELNGDGPLTLVVASLDGEVHTDGNKVKGFQRVDGKTTVYLCLETRQEPKTLRICKSEDLKKRIVSAMECAADYITERIGEGKQEHNQFHRCPTWLSEEWTCHHPA